MYPKNFSLPATEEHYQDLLKEAEMERLIHSNLHQVHPSERDLYRLGQQLVVWVIGFRRVTTSEKGANPFDKGD